MNLNPKLLWENLTPAELDAAVEAKPLAYVPAGSLEWHGEHLPLGCDSIRALAICHRAAAISGGVVLPPLYTTAPGFSAYRGSIFFSGRLVKALVDELLRELRKVGFRGVVLLLGHAGKAQDESFREPAEAYSERYGMKVLVTTGMELIPEELRAHGGHAGASETVQCLAARPGSVDVSRFDPNGTKLPRYEGLNPATYYVGLSEELHEHVRTHMARTEWPWSPDLAEVSTAELGERQLDAMATGLAEQAEALISVPREATMGP
jgi:creatinine amidohydrolase